MTGWSPHPYQVARLGAASTDASWFVHKDVHHCFPRSLSDLVLGQLQGVVEQPFDESYKTISIILAKQF